jgi:acyl dehydratase
VTREKVREFARATGSDGSEGPGGPGGADSEVPPTFPIVVAFTAMSELMAAPGVGIELHRVIHGDQRFTYTRPVRVGDRLTATLSVDSLRQLGGADIIGTRTEITDERGAPVCTAFATLVHRGPEEQ